MVIPGGSQRLRVSQAIKIASELEPEEPGSCYSLLQQ